MDELTITERNAHGQVDVATRLALLGYRPSSVESARVLPETGEVVTSFLWHRPMVTKDRLAKQQAGEDQLAKQQANHAVALLRIGASQQAWPWLKHSPDPGARSYIIHRVAPLGVDPKLILDRGKRKSLSFQR